MQPSMNPLASMLPMLVIWFAIFYVLVFQPQAKAKKSRQQMIANLKKHDEVVTAGGILGTVMNVKQETVILRVDENVRIEVEKAAIERLVKSRGGETELVVEEKRA